LVGESSKPAMYIFLPTTLLLNDLLITLFLSCLDCIVLAYSNVLLPTDSHLFWVPLYWLHQNPLTTSVKVTHLRTTHS